MANRSVPSGACGETSRKKECRMKRYFIIGVALSPPGTMGGNSKIALEMARHLSETNEVHFLVPEVKLPTVTDNLPPKPNLHLHVLPSFPKGEFMHPVAAVRHFCRAIGAVFAAEAIAKDDQVFCCSEAHVETLPLALLKRRFAFTWITSDFLFAPSPWENLSRGYRFPFFKWVFAWFLLKVLFPVQLRYADRFVITNDSDRVHFPARLQKDVFAFYGGVNVEQIPVAHRTQTRDVVFCSRLHPQKGVEGLLDIWAHVVRQDPARRLTLIGNGTPAYEKLLRRKAARLGMEHAIDWLGYVNNAAKYEIYCSARLFVHATVYDNNGMVAAEALCSGLPVVMYDLPALRGVYTTGCHKVPYGDKDAFAAAILSDPPPPTDAEVASLRAQWDWSGRVARFRRFAEGKTA